MCKIPRAFSKLAKRDLTPSHQIRWHLQQEENDHGIIGENGKTAFESMKEQEDTRQCL